ncbi:hypothetical protein SCALM49S_10353 [Streptomyces californicus]
MSVVMKYVPSGSYTWKPAARSPVASRSRLRCMSARKPVKKVSGRASASAIAYWNGPPLTKVRYCFAERTAATSAASPVTQPTFHPVYENVLPADEIETVRPRIPGSAAIGWCAPVKTRCS